MSIKQYNMKQTYLERTNQSWYESELYTALKRLENEAGVALSSEGPWLAGGALRRTLIGAPLTEGDLDIFHKTVAQCVESVAEAMERGVTQAPPAIQNIELDPFKYQLVLYKRFDNIESVLEQFDLSIVCFGFDGTTLYAGDHAFQDLDLNVMRLNNLKSPKGTLKRIVKYTNEGYTFHEESYKTFIDMACAIGPNTEYDYEGN